MVLSSDLIGHEDDIPLHTSGTPFFYWMQHHITCIRYLSMHYVFIYGCHGVRIFRPVCVGDGGPEEADGVPAQDRGGVQGGSQEACNKTTGAPP